MGAGAGPSPRRRGLAAVFDRWVPPTSPARRRPDGLILNPRLGWVSLGIAIAIATLAALVYESLISIAPVPPGGDSGTWILMSYPYAGLPYPTQAAPLTYPPLSFPFLGLSVLVGGPLNGGRLFAGVVIGAMGLAFYFLGRSMFQLRIVPLLMEGALYIQPDFQQLYYFGAYPNMFGFVFFFLAIGLALRFLRSRRPRHLALFWGATAAAVLSHALVAVLLLGLLAVVGVLLLAFRRLPREILLSRAGIIGSLGALVSSFAYYGGQAFFNLGGPNYLAEGSLAEATSRSLFPSMLKPLYLQQLSTAINGAGFTLTETNSVEISAVLAVGTLAFLVMARLLVPRLVSFRHLILASWLLSALLVSLACYAAGIGADYRRVAYFLYPLTILGIGLVLDLFLAYVLSPPAPADLQAPIGAPKVRPLAPGPLRWRRWSGRQAIYVALVAAVVVVSVGVADAYTIPRAQADAKFFTKPGHDAGFVSTMSAVAGSTIPGSIFSSTQVVDRWPATLTARNVYEVRSPTGFTYSPLYLEQDELAFLALNYQLVVTNGQVAAAIPGLNATYFTAAPVFGLYDSGVFHQISQVSPGGIFVTLAGGKATSVFPNGTFVPPEVIAPSSSPANYTLELVYNGSGFRLVENITAVPGSSSVDVLLTAVATGTKNITGVHGTIYGATGRPQTITSSGTTFGWYANTTSGNYSTSGRLTTPGVLTSVAYYAGNATTKARSGSVTFASSVTPSTGNPSLSVGVELSASGTSNPVATIQGLVSSPSVLTAWECRFALFWNGSSATGPTAIAFFETVYGAVPFAVAGDWTVLLLPATFPAY